jgi:hypothetical protein
VLTLRLNVLYGLFAPSTVGFHVAELGNVNCAVRTGTLYKKTRFFFKWLKFLTTVVDFVPHSIPPFVIVQVMPMLQITQNPFLHTELFLECLNPEEEGKTVVRNVRKYSRCSYSFTSNKTEIFRNSNITLRNEQHTLDSVVKRKNLYLAKVNVDVGKTVATLDTRECSLAAQR